MTIVPRFLAVGLINTAVGGLTVMFGLLAGLGDYAANAAGYAVGLLFAYGMHRRWTFAITAPTNLAEAGRFALAVALSYLANFAILYLGRSAGFAGSPFVHAAAIVIYTCVFFVLSRRFVFVEAHKYDDLRGSWRQSWTVWLLIAASIVAWLFLYRIRLSHDLYWQFWIARQMLGGAKLYADIWEINPPLWFWSAMPLQWLAQHTSVAWQSLLVAQVIAMGAVSVWLVGRLIDLPNKIESALLLLAQFWVITIIPLADIGQRDHLALIASLPYAALIARRREGGSVSLPIAIVVGVIGGYGFALKHYFVLIPLILEIWLWVKLRREWRPWRPELFILVTLALIYTASIFLLTPEFFTEMVPMVRLAYEQYNNSYIGLIGNFWVVWWLAVTAYLVIVRRTWLRFLPNNYYAFFQALAIVFACFLVCYFTQQKGWYYHSVPATGALAFGLVLALYAMRHDRNLWLWIGVLLLAIPASTLLTPRPANHSLAPLSEQLLRDVPQGEPVFVATTMPRLAWPTVERFGLVWSSRAFVLWMLPAVAKAKVSGRTTPELEHLSEMVVQTTSQDIRCHPPARIIFQRVSFASGSGAAFELRDFLLSDEALRHFIEEHYELRPSPRPVYVYQRRHPIAGLKTAHCRKIH